MFAVALREKSINFQIDTTGISHLFIHPKSEEFVWKGRRESMITHDDTIDIDRYKIEQVIRNLMSNAIKYCLVGGTIRINAMFLSEAIVRSNSLKQRNSKTEKKESFCSKCVKKFSFHPRIIPAFKSRILPDIEEGLKEEEILGNHGGVRRYTIEGRIRSVVNYAREKINDRFHDTSGVLMIEVKDDGIGMSEEAQRKLFHEIVEISEDRLEGDEDSGLGMWISKGIMDLHQGKCYLESYKNE
jgi:signal transduction histidine kinase